MTAPRLAVLCTILGTTAIAGPAPTPRNGGSAEPRKGPELWFVIGALREEGEKAWRAQQSWPRTEPDYAGEKGWTLPLEDVARALTRSLHADRAVDAYIRTQLLSFIDNPGRLTEPQVGRITATAPKLMPQPVVREEWLAVSGPKRAYIAITRQSVYVRNLRPVVGNGVVALNPELGVVGSGTVLDAEASTQTWTTVVREANDRLGAERARVALANEAILNYRRALMARLPLSDEGRLLAMVDDLRERLVAGDPGIDASCAELVRAVSDVGKSLPPGARRTLAVKVQALSKLHTAVDDSLEAGDGDRKALRFRHVLTVPREHIATMLAVLQDPQPVSRR